MGRRYHWSEADSRRVGPDSVRPSISFLRTFYQNYPRAQSKPLSIRLSAHASYRNVCERDHPWVKTLAWMFAGAKDKGYRCRCPRWKWYKSSTFPSFVLTAHEAMKRRNERWMEQSEHLPRVSLLSIFHCRNCSLRIIVSPRLSSIPTGEFSERERNWNVYLHATTSCFWSFYSTCEENVTRFGFATRW